jgi:nicotinamidase/pyrazinamidase
MARALLIIDFQNDFTPPEGALAVPEGDRIASDLNDLAGSDRFDLVVATRDWHPANHRSFVEQGGPWPEHCIQETKGAELHPALDREKVDVVLDKGQHPDTEGYSAFERPDLERILGEREIDSLTVAGLATDVCVRATALDALRRGFDVQVDASASRGVDREASRSALEEVRRRGGVVTDA